MSGRSLRPSSYNNKFRRVEAAKGLWASSQQVAAPVDHLDGVVATRNLDYIDMHPGLKTPALLPFTRKVVPTVDLAARRIVADPPAGIFPEAEE